MATKKSYDDGGSGLKIKKDRVPELFAGLKLLTQNEVLVGVPSENSDRPPDPTNPKADGITNAELAYIHDNGAPEVNIPARPFMVPGINDAMPQNESIMRKQAQYAIDGKGAAKVNEGFERIGFNCVDKITSVIRAGVPPPLADRTVRNRLRKGDIKAQYELNRRAAGYGASTQIVKPLIDTAEMLKSLTYVVRPRSARKK